MDCKVSYISLFGLRGVERKKKRKYLAEKLSSVTSLKVCYYNIPTMTRSQYSNKVIPLRQR